MMCISHQSEQCLARAGRPVLVLWRLLLLGPWIRNRLSAGSGSRLTRAICYHRRQLMALVYYSCKRNDRQRTLSSTGNLGSRQSVVQKQGPCWPVPAPDIELPVPPSQAINDKWSPVLVGPGSRKMMG